RPLQKKIAKRIDTRYTPRLKFFLDKGVKHSFEINEILGSVLPDPDETTVDASTSSIPDLRIHAPGDDEIPPQLNDEPDDFHQK
ncbi:unnamed protein product, partial [marine sediment metagenome]